MNQHTVFGTPVHTVVAKVSGVVVVMSGGQDSTTCLALAKARFERVHAICFNYGQKHVVEILCARKICEAMGVDLQVVEVPMLAAMADSALLQGGGDVNEPHHRDASLPASFVPNRNALFLTTAHAYAQKVGADYVMTGVCETDYSGYPDCRAVFIHQLQEALNTGYQTRIRILTPLMYVNKAETFAIAQELGCLDVVIDMSHTCYNGIRDIKHDWGRGCGECPACKLRAQGYAKFEQHREAMGQ